MNEFETVGYTTIFEDDLRALRVQFVAHVAALLTNVHAIGEFDDDLSGCRTAWTTLERHIDHVHSAIVQAMRVPGNKPVQAFNYTEATYYLDVMMHHTRNLNCAAHQTPLTPRQRKNAVGALRGMMAVTRDLFNWGVNMQVVHNDSFVDVWPIDDEDPTEEHTILFEYQDKDIA